MEEEEENRLRYVDSQEHKVNLRAALDQCSVKEPDLELVSADGRRVFGHRSVLGIFSPLLVDLFSHTPCCQMATIVFPDTSSEILSHLLNMLYTGSTEASSESMSILAGEDGVFATASLLGITITPEQKVIEVLDRRENILEEEEEEQDQIVIEGEERIEELPINEEHNNELAERMEICPSIPMFDLAGLATLAQWHGEQERGDGEEVPEGPVENEDYYICKLTSCQTMIMFENCGARSKILNHYTSHFQRELEDQFGHLLTDDMQCTMCGKQLGNYIKSKVWSHIGVTHDKTNEILASKGIPPIAVNIRGSKVAKRKASEAFPEEVSPRFETGFPPAHHQQQILATPTPLEVAGELAEAWRDGSSSWGGGGGRNNCCRICGQVTQNRKRLLKHYCTRHFIDRLGALEYSFIVRNKCVECGRDFVGAKKSSKVIHIGVEHKQIFPILEHEFGQGDNVPRAEEYRPAAKRQRPASQDTSSPLVVPSSPLVIPKANKSPSNSQLMIPVQHNLPRVQLDMSNAMMAIQARGNECLVCGKSFDLFRSMLLPHYCGHFYKEIAQGHEEYFTEENCKLCGATATKRKSRIIHLGVKHELVLPYIQEVIKMRGEEQDDGDDGIEIKEEDEVEEVEYKDEEVEVQGNASLVEVKEESEEEDLVVRMDDTKEEEQEEREEDKVTEEEKVVSRIIETVSQEISNTNGSVEKYQEEVPEGTLTPLPSSPPCITVPSPRPRTPAAPAAAAPTGSTPATPSLPTKSTPADPPATKLIVPSPAAPKSLPQGGESLPTAGSSIPASPAAIRTKVIARPDAETRPAGREDDLSEATLGLTCRICSASEASTHEMLTHYCNHFTEQLKKIAEKNVNEDQKCVECGKMLGNNKRRLLHFGVHHAHVLPLVSSHLRSLGPQEEEKEEDAFEVTLDPVVNSPVKAKEPKVVKEAKLVRKASGTPRTCEICGVKRNTNANLLRHYSREHFVLEIEEGYGHLMIGATCSLCHTVVDCTARGVGDAEKWVHLGVRHGVTNTLLQQQGWNPVHLRDKQENGTLATPAAVPSSNGVAQVSQVTTTPSPPPPPPESPEIFSCDLCDKKTKNQNLLNLHLIAMHYKKEILASYGNPEHQCKVCRKLLPNADAFAFHIGQDHNKLAEFVKKKPAAVKAKVTNGDVVNGDSGGGQLACFKCGSVGKDKAALYGHYSLHHFSQELMGEFGVQTLCPVTNCGHTSDSGTNWIEHIGEAHSAVEKYLPVEHHLPPSTSTSTSSSSTTSSNANKALVCPIDCPEDFDDEQQLTNHFRSQHGFSQEVVQKMKERNFALKTKDA